MSLKTPGIVLEGVKLMFTLSCFTFSASKYHVPFAETNKDKLHSSGFPSGLSWRCHDIVDPRTFDSENFLNLS